MKTPSVANAGSIAVSHVSSLDDTSTIATSKVTLPKGEILDGWVLARFRQQDPYHLFAEGVDNDDFGLCIENKRGKVTILAAGWSFTDGEVDGALTTTVKALQFSNTEQRYLITCASNESSEHYALMVNVSGTQAKIWMRETKDDGTLLPWKLALKYRQP